MAKIPDKLKVESQLGIRFVSVIPENLREQSALEAVVVSPEKLAAHGYKGLRSGDKLSLVVLEKGRRFSVASPVEKGVFLLDDKIGVKLEPLSLQRHGQAPSVLQRPGVLKPAVK